MEISQGTIKSPKQINLTEITADDDSSQNDCVKIVHWLKKEIRDEITFGVEGKNLVTGGSGIYKNIAFTKGAKNLLGDGVEWKSAYSDRSVFYPVENKNAK